MEVDMNENKQGSSKSNLYTEEHLGKALSLFIQEMDLVESNIGKIYGTEKNRRMITGLQSDDGYDNCDLCCSSKNKHNIINKLKYKNKDLVEIMSNSMDKFNVSEDTKNQLIERYRLFEDDKLVSNIFKQGSKCLVNILDDGRKFKEGSINTIFWELDTDGNLGIRYIITVGTGFECKKVKTDISKFGIELRKISGDNSLGSKANLKLLRATNYGIIKTPVLKYGNYKVIFDNVCAYFKNNEDTYIIGYWANGFNKFIKNDNYKLLENLKNLETAFRQNLDYVYLNKKFIAPYGTIEENVLEIK